VETAASVTAQARATGSLLRFAAWQKEDNLLPACRRAIGQLVRQVYVSPQVPERAFVNPSQDVASLQDAAATLDALCAYRQVAQDKTWDDLIGRLGNLLLFLQREDGSFHAAYDSAAHKAVQSEGPTDMASQADAAGALALAYGELNAPRLLLGAQKSLEYLSQQDLRPAGPEAGRRFVEAARELSVFLPVDRQMPQVWKVADALRDGQLSPEEVPAPDLAGGILHGYPPPVAETAADLEVFVSAWLLTGQRKDAESRAFGQRTWPAALAAARYLVQFQFTPENSYYLEDPGAALGGFRWQPGSNLVILEGVERGLDGLRLLAESFPLVPKESP